jgi:hypothetical protein
MTSSNNGLFYLLLTDIIVVKDTKQKGNSSMPVQTYYIIGVLLVFGLFALGIVLSIKKYDAKMAASKKKRRRR